MMKYEHLFFDLDRTLWDFESNSKESLQELYLDFALEERGIPGFDAFHTTYFKHNNKLWERFRKGYISRKDLGFKRMWHVLLDYKIMDTNMAQAMNEKYVATLPYKRRLMPGTKEVLNYLKEKGYALHIITNGYKKGQEIKLCSSGIAQYFDVVVTSELAGRPKPHPDIFRYAMDQTQCDCRQGLMVGDALEIDIAGAQNMEMDTVYFNPENIALSHIQPTYVISDWEQLKRIL